ncbi:hypothetical protein ABBQ38_011910 [Trebouxia sp. C0009 RCD-2024]
MSITAVNPTDGIRVDRATQKGSVYDVVQMVLKNGSRHTTTTFTRLLAQHPELHAGCVKLRINGKGRPTPVANARTRTCICASGQSNLSGAYTPLYVCTMEDLYFQKQTCTIHGSGRTIPILIACPDGTEYFRGNDVAEFLGYKQPAIAITKHVRERHIKTLQEVLERGVYDSYTPSNPNKNDLASRWITEPGLYQLVFKPHMACAEQFQDFVFESVLPGIRKTGFYSVQSAIPAAQQTDAWLDKLYAIAANHINQAVLGFTQTTTSFKKQKQLPRHINIPDILNMQGLVARCYAETCFQKFVSYNLQHLRGLSEAELVKEFAGLKLNLRQGFVSTGMGDLQSKLLTVAEAKKRKADIGLHSRKQQKLMQAEQPKARECVA